MNEVKTSEYTGEPVTLAEAKEQLAIESSITIDDSLVTSLVQAAVSFVEEFTGKCLHAQTFVHYSDQFHYQMKVQRRPVLDIVSVKYVNAAGTLITMDSADYQSSPRRGLVVPAYNQSWPTTRSVVDAVQIEYRAGYVDTAASPETGTIPFALKHAVKILVAHYYEHREPAIAMNKRLEEVPLHVREMLFPYVEWPL